MAEPATSFAALGVPTPLVDVLDDQGIAAPFPVQAATLPDALAGRDILGRARTGSGKTLGFSLPLVSRLAGGRSASGRPRGLVLVPTRELATQVSTVLRPLAGAMDLWVTTIYGGVSYGPQVNALRRGTDIVVATPGRLADLIGQAECDLSDVEITVIDEADQMADLGFLPIVNRLLETTPDDGQRMLFSATLDAAVDVLARRFLSDPVLHSVDENSSPAEIEHHVLTVDGASRVAVIAALAGGDKRSLVFTRTKHGAERLARQLTQAGIPAAELHGNLAQGARTRNLAAFASGLARVMVATDIAARGIHIDGIELVIHADPPAEHKAYVHRSGRTARGGADGVVVTLQTKAQVRDVTAMMRKADIAPHPTVAVDPDSGVLTDIAGPAAPRVTVTGKVAELVKPEDRLARNDRPGVGKPWQGRPRRDRAARAGGRRGDGERRPSRRNDASFQDDRAQRDDRNQRDDRAQPADRAQRDDRGPRDGRAYRDQREQGDWRPYQGGDQRAYQGGDQRSYRDESPRYERGYRDDRGQRGGRPYGDHRDGSQRGARGDRDHRDDSQGDARPYRGGSDDRAQRGGRYDRDHRDDSRGSARPYRDRDDRGNWSNRDRRPDQGNWSPEGRPNQGNWSRDGRPSQADWSQRDGRPNRGDWSQRDGRPYRDREARSQRDGRTQRDDRNQRDDRTPRGDRQGQDGRANRDGAYQGRSYQGGPSSRDQGPYRGEQPSYQGGRPGRAPSGARPQSGGRAKPGWRPAADGQAFRSRSGRTGRPQGGGPVAGSSRRSGYSAGRGSAGKRRG
jgi:superfamily II DNA/RNA helicase